MARWLFPADLVFNPDGTLAQTVAFTFWDAQVSGNQHTDIVAPNGTSSIDLFTTPDGQRPELRGPDEVKGMWQDTGATYRQFVVSAEALDAKLQESPSGGAGDPDGGTF